MDQVTGFLNKKLFAVDGMTLTVGVALVVVVLVYFVWFKK